MVLTRTADTGNLNVDVNLTRQRSSCAAPWDSGIAALAMTPPFETSSVTKYIVTCNNWILPRSAAFKRFVEGMQKPDSSMSLVADD